MLAYNMLKIKIPYLNHLHLHLQNLTFCWGLLETPIKILYFIQEGWPQTYRQSRRRCGIFAYHPLGKNIGFRLAAAAVVIASLRQAYQNPNFFPRGLAADIRPCGQASWIKTWNSEWRQHAAVSNHPLCLDALWVRDNFCIWRDLFFHCF